jgi:hypothetical protein
MSLFTLGACEKYLGSSTSNLSGTWDIYKVTQKAYTNGSLDSTNVQEDLGTITFNSGGDGNYSVSSDGESSSGDFDWFEQNDKVFINMMNLSDSVMTKNLAVGFDVITNSATQQVWSLTFSYYSNEENPSTGNYVDYLKKNYIEVDLRKQ